MGTQTISSFDSIEGLEGNTLEFERGDGGSFDRSKIIFKGTGNKVYIEKGTKFNDVTLVMAGNDGVAWIRKSGYRHKVHATVFTDSVLYIDSNVSVNGSLLIQAEEQQSVVIGKDAMFSREVIIRNADPHMIYDAATNTRINHAKPVWIGDHVWIGHNVFLIKGAAVGSGAILGARALVNGAIPSNVLAGGLPARPLKRDVFWTRPTAQNVSREEAKKLDVTNARSLVYQAVPGTSKFDELNEAFHGCDTAEARFEWCQSIQSLIDHDRFALSSPSPTEKDATSSSPVGELLDRAKTKVREMVQKRK